MKLTVQTTISMMWYLLNDLQHNASLCNIQWNIQKLHLSFAICSFSLSCVTTTPVLLSIIDGAPSVATTDSTGPVHTSPVQHSHERDENICYSDVHHWSQFQDLLNEGQSLVYVTNKYIQLCNISSVPALINCNQTCYKWLDFVFQLPIQTCRKIWNLTISHTQTINFYNN